MKFDACSKAAIILTIGLSAWQSAAAAGNGYDFSYTAKGDRVAHPTQVFDSGAETFFQYAADKTIPAFFAVSPCGKKVLLAPEQRGPYFVVPGVYQKYVLQLGVRTAQVEYTGTKDIPLEENIANEPSCDSGSQRYANYGVSAPRNESAIAEPIRGDSFAIRPKVQVVLTSAPAQRPVSKVQAADPFALKITHPSGITETIEPLRDSGSKQVAQGGKSSTVQVASVPAPAALPTWDVRSDDVRLANTFERWAAKAGYKIQWDADRHVLISATSAFTGTFEDAVASALSTPGIRFSEYPLEACIYENSPPLLRITRQGEQAAACPSK